jgi:hypothetical protein
VAGTEVTTGQYKEELELQFHSIQCEKHYVSDAASANKQRKNSRYLLNKYHGRPCKRKSKLFNVTVDTTCLPPKNFGKY